jgi:ribonuclease D
MPGDAEQLQRIRGLPPTTWRRHGDALLERIAAARAEPPDQWPAQLRRPRLAPEQSKLVDELLDLIVARANQHGISPQAVADRRDVEHWLAGQDSPLRHGWRAALIERELQARVASGFDP